MARPKGELRSGYTTGACATAATKGALSALIEQCVSQQATIQLPGGRLVAFVLHTCAFDQLSGTASVIKDAGDDPDVTHRAEICARVRWADSGGVLFRRGPGVGLVTKPGLPVPPGEPAINPVPRSMIRQAVGEVLAAAGLAGRSVEVEISVPTGEQLAIKTFNPRLGILGGISILGTTGIVEPYSTAAWLASVVQAIDVAVAQGSRGLVLTVGARGERFARAAFPHRSEAAFVQIGPFFGDALQHCARAGVESICLFAMIGKLAKFAAGNESVHSSKSRQDFDFLARLAQASGGEARLAERIRQANTAQEVAELVSSAGLMGFFDLLCQQAWHVAEPLLAGKCRLSVYVTGIHEQVLGKHVTNAE